MVGPFNSPGLGDLMNVGAPPVLPADDLQPPDPMAATEDMEGDDGPIIPRDGEDLDTETEERKALVSQIMQDVKTAKAYWEKPFKRMVEDMEFAAGDQWAKANTLGPDVNVEDHRDPRYIANITLRHVQQKVAGLYARNPKAVAKRRKRVISKLWDGTQAQVQVAMQLLQQNPANAKALQIVQDYNATMDYNTMMDRMAQTLELAYDYEVSQQDYPFKAGMKRVVRRAATSGVGYVKLGFQRMMKMSPEKEQQVADYSNRLATMERLNADISDGEVDENAPERERLRLLIQDISAEPDIVAREGLTFSYPMPWSIIPDTNIIDLNTFLGCDWVAEEFLLTPAKIQEIWKVDIGRQYQAYAPGGQHDTAEAAILARINGSRSQPTTAMVAKDNRPGVPKAMVWQVWNKTDGLVYTVCDGYPDFLEEPLSPDAWTERFWPWFALTLNDLEHPSQIFPPSDVSLIRDPQKEINRSREGLREHRVANRPKTAVAAGTLDDDDIEKLQKHPANAVLELNALAPGQKIEDILQPIKMPGIDPNLYDVSPAFQDIERTVGVQEANLGGTSSATATESSISESSRQTQLASNVDDLNEMLTAMAKNGGQIMLTNMSKETIIEIVGEGAVWPELSREDIAKEISLQVAAGSTGKPNQAQEIANAEKLVPLLLQIPGVNPEWVLEQVIRRLDDSIDLTQAFTQGMPSIVWLNSQAGGGGMLGTMAAAALAPPQAANDPGAGGAGPPAQGGAPQPSAAGAGPMADPAAQGQQGVFNQPQPPAPSPNDPLAVPTPQLRDFHNRSPVG